MSEGIPYTTVLNNKLQGRSRDNWSLNDLIALVICLLLSTLSGVLIAMWAESAYTGLLTGFATAGILYLLVLRRSSRGYGRGYRAYWLWAMSKKDHIHWKADDPKYPAQLKNLPDIQYLAPDENAPHRIALLHHADRGYDQLYIRATGGAFASTDVHGQNRLVAELEKTLSMVLSMTDLHAGVASLRVIAPADMDAVKTYTAQFGDPTIFAEGIFRERAADTELSRWFREVYDDMITEVQGHLAADNWGLIVLTIRRQRRQWHKVKKGKATRQQIYELPVFDLGLSLVEALQESSLNLANIHILEAHELFLLCRCSWDVYGISEFYNKYSEIVKKHLKDKDLMQQLRSELSCWPEHVVQTHDNDVVQWDDNYLVVMRVEQIPRLLRADTSLALHYEVSGKFWTRHYHGGEVVSGATETIQLMVQQSWRMNLEEALFGRLLVRHPQLARKARALKEQTDLVSAVAIAQLSNNFWATVAASPVEARKQARKMMATLAPKDYRASIVKLSTLHVDAVLTASLGASRL